MAKLERLHVGIGGDELDALEVRLDHAVDGIAAAAAHADDFDASRLVGFPRETECASLRLSDHLC